MSTEILRLSRLLLVLLLGLNVACGANRSQPAGDAGGAGNDSDGRGVEQYGDAEQALDDDTDQAPIAGSAVRSEATATTHYVEGEAARARADADVLMVKALQEDEALWRFEVSIAHPDKGPEDFADGWDVVLPSGEAIVLEAGLAFTQAISSPSVGRQPMDFAQTNIPIPSEIDKVLVRAHDSRSGFGGREIPVLLNQSSGPGFEVSRTY